MLPGALLPSALTVNNIGEAGVKRGCIMTTGIVFGSDYV